MIERTEKPLCSQDLCKESFSAFVPVRSLCAVAHQILDEIGGLGLLASEPCTARATIELLESRDLDMLPLARRFEVRVAAHLQAAEERERGI